MVPHGASILLGVVAILRLLLTNSPLGSGTILLVVVFNFILRQLLLQFFFVKLVFTPPLAVSLNCCQS